MIMDESAFIGEEEDPDITQNHETNVLGIPTIRPVSRVWATAKRGTIPLQLDPFFPSSSVDTHTLRTKPGITVRWNRPLCPRPVRRRQIPVQCQHRRQFPSTSIDGIAASHKSIIASVESPLYDCFRAPAPSLSSTMRTSTKAFASSSNLPRLNDLSPKPHSNQPRALAIPPSPRTPPPRPPNSLSPPTASESFLHFDFPSPPTPLSAGVTEMRQDIWPKSPSSRRVPHPFALAQTLPLQSQKPITVGDTFMLNEPPAIPPRSKLRPPPVKIPGPRRQAYRTKIEVSGQYSEYVSPTHSRSSSFTTFRTISPLPTPPIYSRSSSFAPFIDSPRPAAPLHSHSASVASSDFVISPMPTPPPLSPSEFSPSSPPWARPDTPEPRIDLDVLRALISQRGGPNLVGEPQSEGGMSLEAIARAHESSDDDLTTCGTTIPEFGFQEEPRAPPSRVSFYESPERVHTPSDIDDDAFSTYSHFSSTYYTFRRRSSSTRRKRSVRRNGSKGGRRRMTPVSMISVYSQASFCSQDAVDAPSVPILPAMTGDSIGGHEDLDENDLGEMVFEAPEYAYAFSWDDYVDHGLEGSALAGRSPVRSGSDFEAALFSRPNRREDSAVDSEIRPDDDWRALLTAQDKGKLKRRTSSNISVVENAVPIIQVPMATDMARPALTDASSLATSGSISDISTTSTSPPRALLPNRRKRTIRTRIGTTVPYPSTPEYPPTTPRSGESSSAPNVMSTLVKPKGTTTETKSPLRGMKKRVSVFKSLVSFTLALPRSPSSPTFPPGPPPAPIPSVPAASPHASSWTPGHGLFLSPTATSSTIPVAI
ncbi:hypothetical protein K438DRAFT_631452 [Mycena galopus ATCC 62051]|nr:hypothetical protein K438DRAFT_631452 [Mycena galopus ATCC 62051]